MSCNNDHRAEERSLQSILAIGPDARNHFRRGQPARDFPSMRAILASNPSAAPLVADLLEGLVLDVDARPAREATCRWPHAQSETQLTLVVDDPAHETLHVVHFAVDFARSRRLKLCNVSIYSAGMLLRCGDEWLARWALEPKQCECLELTLSPHGETITANFGRLVGRGGLAMQQVANLADWIGDLLFSPPRSDVINAVAAKIAAEEAGWLSVPLTAEQAALSEQLDRRRV